MRVLHVIDTLWLGGAQSVVKTFFEKQKGNKDIFLYALRQTEPQITISHENIFIHSSGSRYSLSPIPELKHFITEKKIDILHCHLPRAQIFGYLLKRVFFPGIKLVFHEQGVIHDYPIILPILFNQFKNKVDAFIVCSEDNKEVLYLKVKNVETKTFYLPNFVDTKLYETVKKVDRESCRKKLGLGPNDFAIGFAGRIVKRKGWEELIEAAVILKNEENIRIIISGIGPEQNKMLAMINKYNLAEKVIYLGYVSNMTEFYATVDCLILPSYWEGMSLSQQEAIASGLPIIISEDINDPTQGEFPTFKNKNPKDMALKIKMQQKFHDQGNVAKPDDKLLSVLVYNEQLFMDGLEQVYKSI